MALILRHLSLAKQILLSVPNSFTLVYPCIHIVEGATTSLANENGEKLSSEDSSSVSESQEDTQSLPHSNKEQNETKHTQTEYE